MDPLQFQGEVGGPPDAFQTDWSFPGMGSPAPLSMGSPAPLERFTSHLSEYHQAASPSHQYLRHQPPPQGQDQLPPHEQDSLLPHSQDPPPPPQAHQSLQHAHLNFETQAISHRRITRAEYEKRVSLRVTKDPKYRHVAISTTFIPSDTDHIGSNKIGHLRFVALTNDQSERALSQIDVPAKVLVKLNKNIGSESKKKNRATQNNNADGDNSNPPKKPKPPKFFERQKVIQRGDALPPETFEVVFESFEPRGILEVETILRRNKKEDPVTLKYVTIKQGCSLWIHSTHKLSLQLIRNDDPFSFINQGDGLDVDDVDDVREIGLDYLTL